MSDSESDSESTGESEPDIDMALFVEENPIEGKRRRKLNSRYAMDNWWSREAIGA